MAESAYELLALGMRYAFVLIGALMLWRAFRWMRRDARQYRRDMRTLPDAGLVGEMVELQTGSAQPLPREGTIDSSRECDIRIRGDGVRRDHALFAFEDGKGLKITPRRGAPVLLSGTPIRSYGYALHGTQLQLGGAVLRVRLFAGLNVPFPAAYQPEAPDVPLQDLSFAEEEESAPPPFPAPDACLPPEWQEQEAPLQQPGYDGHYDEDGQMTWQYAYSLEELRRAQEDAPPEEDDGGALPYQSPVPRRRRRDRHG